jgi:hypothetical protein
MSRTLEIVNVLEAGWIASVTSTAVYEGPPGTMGSDKTPNQMASVLLSKNKSKTKGSILRYMQYVINRSGKNMNADHKAKIKQAMEIVRNSKHKE